MCVHIQKASTTFIMSVHPSVLTYQFGSHWMDFCEICYLRLSLKSSKILKMLLQKCTNIWNLTWRPSHVSLLLATLNHHKSTVFEWNGMRLLGGIKIMWTWDTVGLYVYCLSFISLIVFSLYFFYLDDSGLVGCDTVGQLVFDLIQTLHFSYYHHHKPHFTSYKLAEDVVV